MKLAQSVKIGAWLLIVLNLLMAFGSIWKIMRMAPAIKVIIAQNLDAVHTERLKALIGPIGYNHVHLKFFQCLRQGLCPGRGPYA